MATCQQHEVAVVTVFHLQFCHLGFGFQSRGKDRNDRCGLTEELYAAQHPEQTCSIFNGASSL